MHNLERFFELNMLIKKEMNRMCPPAEFQVEEYAMMRYSDELFKSVSYIYEIFGSFANEYFGENSDCLKRIELLKKETIQKLAECNLDSGKFRKFYERYISGMNPKFIDSVKKNCFGYVFDRDVLEPVGLASSVNEVLHFFHSYVVNNEIILKEVPMLAEKPNMHGEAITLRGVSVPEFNNLFAEFPQNLDCGITDMVAVSPNKLVVMIRDRGHATTIELTLKGDLARCEYFIPKICNVDMVNKLPGVNKIKDDTIGATGVFEINKKNMANAMFDFVSKVPTDADMAYGKTNN